MIPYHPLDVTLWSLGLTFVFESITLLLRFGLGLEWDRVSRRNVGVVTFGYRIHHGFVGLALVVLALCLPAPLADLKGLALATGNALFLSDMIHHFLVLLPLTGTPQFYFQYR